MSLHPDTRWAAFDAESRQRFAKELITLGPGADHGRMAHRGGLGQVNSAGRDVAEYNLERKRTSSTSSADLLKRPAVDTYPRYGWARPGHACLWTDVLNPL